MLKPVRPGYGIFFQLLPDGLDAIYIYKPGRGEIAFLRPEFQVNDILRTFVVGHLQSVMDQKVRATKGQKELEVICKLEDLDFQEPDFTVENTGTMAGYTLPGGEVSFIGKFGDRRRIV